MSNQWLYADDVRIEKGAFTNLVCEETGNLYLMLPDSMRGLDVADIVRVANQAYQTGLEHGRREKAAELRAVISEGAV